MNRRRRVVPIPCRSLFPELAALLLVALAAPAGAQLQLLGYQWLSQNVSGVDGAPELGDLFGSSLAAGDFNCDGYDDLAVGVPHEDEDGVTRSGAVNVLYGGPAGLTGGELWSQADNGVPSSNEPFDQFGEVLEAFYRNRDAFMCDSLAVGAPNEAANGEDIDDAGAVWIFRGTASGLVPDGILVQGQDGVPESAEAGDRFGASISQGPLTGDPDDCTPVETPTSLLIGAPGEGLGLGDNGHGAVVRITMPCDTAGGGVGSLPSFVVCELFQEEPCRVLTASSFDLPVDLDPYDGFGGSLAFLRHDADAGWNGGDPIVGVPDANEAGGSASIGAFLESERNWAAVGSQYWTQDSSGVQQVAEASDHFAEVLEEGDFDGDGDEDLAIGTPRESGGADIDVGVVHALYSTGTAPSKELTATGDFLAAQGDLAGEATEAYDEFGGALAAGDFDGDGVDDLAVGIPGEDLSSPRVVADAGKVNVLFGVAGTGLSTAGARNFDGDDLFFNGANASGYFGSALAAGDFDGNGIDDLAIGEPGDSTLDNS
ncbi:MAG: integrin alpha [Thermoanaerobaculia bacterium]|nr:integrin alpha [Thermoanaerobaculia bacterium]